MRSDNRRSHGKAPRSIRWASTSWDTINFIELYSKLIDNIREFSPGRIFIYNQLLGFKAQDQNNSIYTNERICAFNEALSKLAAEKELFFIDTYSALCNEDGYLPEDASFDGVHLIKDYCIQWLDYLKTHTAVPAGCTGEEPNGVQLYYPDKETGGSDIIINGR